MKTTLWTFAILLTLASRPLAANADTTTPTQTTPPMARTNDMMGGAGTQMGDAKMGAMMGQMQQMMKMMEMMEMMQKTRMMNACEKMMAGMSMMDKGAGPMMNTPSTPAPKG